MNHNELQQIANKIRLATFGAISHAGGGHYGGCLSIVEILTALYFGEILKIDVSNHEWRNRDRFVLGKGHGGPALYVTLMKKGVLSWDMLAELDANGGRLPKHVDRLKTPGIEVSTGPLGQGLSIASGMALGLKLDKSTARTYILLSDGDCNEGQLWEAAMLASKYHLDNLTAIIDRNCLQIDGHSEDVMPLEPFAEKWKAFGWNVLDSDGHGISELIAALRSAADFKGKPTVIIAKTVKGKGVSFMENNYVWHSGTITQEQFESGRRQLEQLVLS